MPSWDFECNVCGHRVNDVTAGINEYDEVTFKDKPCLEACCPGLYDHTFTRPANFTFKRGAPTPRFGR